MATDYERSEADPERRRTLRREELILEVTEALVRTMNEAGITRAELARRIDKTRGHVTQVLAGGRNLTLASLSEMADALGCRVEIRLVAHGRPPARKAKATTRSARKAAAAKTPA